MELTRWPRGPAWRVRARWRTLWWPTAGIALFGVFLLGTLSVHFAPEGSEVAAWWPAAGLAVAFLAVTPRRRRPLFLAGVAVLSALANVVGGRPADVAACYGLANAAEAGVVIWWLTRDGPGRPTLLTMGDLRRLLVAAGLGGLVVGGLAGLTVTVLLDGPLVLTWRTVLASHVASVLLIAPLGLAVAPGRRITGTAERVGVAVQWVAAVGGVLLVFGPNQGLPLAFAPMPVLVWGALRQGMRPITVQLLVVGTVASMRTSAGDGPFAASSIVSDENVAALMQAYLVALSLVVLPLLIAMAQRRTALLRVTTSERMFRSGFRDSLIGMMLLRPAGDGLEIVEVNPVAATMLGGDVDNLRGLAWETRLVPEDAAGLLAAVRGMVSGRSPGWRAEVRLAGEPTRWADCALSRAGGIRDGQLFTAQMVDVTAARLAQGELERERDFTAAVLDTTRSLLLVVDHEGAVVRVNRAVEELSGVAGAELAGRPVWAVMGAPEEGLRTLVERSRAGEEVALHQAPWSVGGGRHRTVLWGAAPLAAPGGPPLVVMSGVDVTEERAARELLLDVLDAATGTAIVGTDQDGTVTFVNAGAEHMLGYGADELVGVLPVTALHDPEELADRARQLRIEPGFGALVAHIARGERVERRDWTYVRKDGGRLTVSLAVSAMRDAAGAVTGYLVVGEDVTERRRTEAVVRSALIKERLAVQRLQEVDKVKSELVSSVSHELRTPITSVLGYTEMLETGVAGPLTDRQRELLSRVERGGRRLLSLTEDLLTMSRVESGALQLQRRQVDLREVVRRALEAVDLLLSTRVLALAVDLPEDPVPVLADPDTLERAVINLLDNAAKFTPDHGRVSVTVSVREDTAALVVADTGIGIPVDEQDALFSRFFRSSTSEAMAIRGTGLGLAIVHAIVTAHEGEVSVASAPGTGTAVTLTLPLDPPAPHPRPAAPVPAAH